MTPQPLLERLITRYPRYCNFMGYFTHKSQPVKSLRTVYRGPAQDAAREPLGAFLGMAATRATSPPPMPCADGLAAGHLERERGLTDFDVAEQHRRGAGELPAVGIEANRRDARALQLESGSWHILITGDQILPGRVELVSLGIERRGLPLRVGDAVGGQ